jgi:hypothetical protein
LLDKEVAVYTGSTRCCNIEFYGVLPQDYSKQIKWLPAVESGLPNPITIVAMDALKKNPKKSDIYSTDELFWLFRKATAAFTAAKMHGHAAVHTGAWGAGVFNGSVVVGFVIQALAAAAAGVQMMYHHLAPNTPELAPALAFIAQLGMSDQHVAINRPNLTTPWGFGIGQEQINISRIKIVAPGGCSDGILHPNDIVNTINGISIAGMAHKDIVDVIMSTTKLRVSVGRADPGAGGSGCSVADALVQLANVATVGDVPACWKTRGTKMMMPGGGSGAGRAHSRPQPQVAQHQWQWLGPGGRWYNQSWQSNDLIEKNYMYGARFSSGSYTRGCHWFPRLLALSEQACDQWHSSRVSSFLSSSHCKLRPNTEGTRHRTWCSLCLEEAGNKPGM